MKRRYLAILLAGAIACDSSVDAPVVQPPATVTLGVGQQAAIAGGAWSVRFDSVQSDNRCPAGALCTVTAGSATLVFELRNPLLDPTPGTDFHFTLSTDPVETQGYRFTVTDVRPLKQINQPIDPQSYRASLKIEPGILR